MERSVQSTARQARWADGCKWVSLLPPMRAAILDSCFGLHLDLARSKHGMNLSSGLKRRQSNLSPAGQLLKP